MTLPHKQFARFARRVAIQPIFAILFAWAACQGTIAQGAGELLVADRVSNRLLAFDADSGAFRRVVLAEGLADPAGLAVDPDGSVYVANLQGGDVLKVDPNSGIAETFASGILGPSGLAYDPVTDSLFVGEFGNFDGNNVRQYDAGGEPMAEREPLRTISAGPTAHGGIAIGAEGDLYVSSFATDAQFSGNVLRFDAATDYAPLGVFASGGGLSGANGIAFDLQGDLFVAGLFGQSVVKYDVEQGVVESTTPAFGGVVAYPSGLLTLPDGTLIVTSLGNNNPADPIWQGNLFPGALLRIDPVTGARLPFLRGDLNGDLSVDQLDISVWEGALASTDSGDVDANGLVDGADLLAWQRYVGNVGYVGDFQPTAVVYVAESAALAAVPEPGLWTLVVGATVCLQRRRR